MIKVHHLETSRSTRLIWALEELGLEYELVEYKRHPKTRRAPDTAKSLHPLGRFPLLEIDGKVIVESGAILTYLVEREGKLGPADGAKEDYTYWMHYAEGSAMLPLLVKLITSGVRGAPVPFSSSRLPRPLPTRLTAISPMVSSRPTSVGLRRRSKGSHTSRAMRSPLQISRCLIRSRRALPERRCFRIVPIPRPGSTALRHVQLSRRRARRAVNPS